MPRRTRIAPRQPLTDDAVIVRGGRMLPADLLNSLEVARRHTGRRGLSVYGDDVLDREQLIRTLSRGDPPLLPHPMVRFGTAGAIRRAGYEIVPTGAPPHQTIAVRHAARPEDLFGLVGAFEPAVRRDLFEGAV